MRIACLFVVLHLTRHCLALALPNFAVLVPLFQVTQWLGLGDIYPWKLSKPIAAQPEAVAQPLSPVPLSTRSEDLFVEFVEFGDPVTSHYSTLPTLSHAWATIAVTAVPSSIAVSHARASAVVSQRAEVVSHRHVSINFETSSYRISEKVVFSTPKELFSTPKVLYSTPQNPADSHVSVPIFSVGPKANSAPLSDTLQSSDFRSFLSRSQNSNSGFSHRGPSSSIFHRETSHPVPQHLSKAIGSRPHVPYMSMGQPTQRVSGAGYCVIPGVSGPYSNFVMRESLQLNHLSYDYYSSHGCYSWDVSIAPPTLQPVVAPTSTPTTTPTALPTVLPTTSPTTSPTLAPAPAPAPSRTPSLRPTFAPATTFVPTPAPGKKEIVYNSKTTMTGITKAQFNEDAQLGFKRACAATLQLPVNRIAIISIDDARRRLLRRSTAAAPQLENVPPTTQLSVKVAPREIMPKIGLKSLLASATTDSFDQRTQKPQTIDFVSKFVSPLIGVRSITSSSLEEASVDVKVEVGEDQSRFLTSNGLAVQWQATVVVLDTVNPETVANDLTSTVSAAMTVGGSFFTALTTAMTNITASTGAPNVFASVTGIAVVSLGYTVNTYAPTSAPTHAPTTRPPSVQTRPKKEPEVGVIVGSTIGSVVGFVLLVYLLYYFIIGRNTKSVRPLGMSGQSTRGFATQSTFSRVLGYIGGNFVTSQRAVRPTAVQPARTVSIPEPSFNIVPSAGMSQPRRGQVAAL